MDKGFTGVQTKVEVSSTHVNGGWAVWNPSCNPCICEAETSWLSRLARWVSSVFNWDTLSFKICMVGYSQEKYSVSPHTDSHPHRRLHIHAYHTHTYMQKLLLNFVKLLFLCLLKWPMIFYYTYWCTALSFLIVKQMCLPRMISWFVIASFMIHTQMSW